MARWIIVLLLGIGVVTGFGLVSATQVKVATFHSLGQKTDEARAAVYMKVQFQPWGTDHAYAKFAGSMRVGAASGVRWAVRAATPGKTHRWSSWSTDMPQHESLVGSLDDACS
ncbi:hypothetical protein LZC95_18280 [Pendulispora brunnea]|uniref:Uncharacterized protein n=1 Tax=Pendulispora brunnea TaxID=2905690 RepID=A0ABZ2KNW9_9BACT